MAITNPITQAKIIAEFGGGYPFVLGNYRRGAGIVPSHSGTLGIPTGYPISFQNFLGASASGVVLSAANQNHDVFAPNNAWAGLEFAGGFVRGRTGSAVGPTNNKYQYLYGSASSFDVRYTHQSGTVPAGAAMNTWYNLGSSSAQIFLQATTNTTLSSSCLAEIRPAGGGSVLASATFTLNVSRNI